jgi:hypothetical protein
MGFKILGALSRSGNCLSHIVISSVYYEKRDTHEYNKVSFKST